MHNILIVPDSDHPLAHTLKEYRKVRVRYQNKWTFGTKKGKDEKARLNKELHELKLSALNDFREQFPAYKDAEVKLILTVHTNVWRMAFEVVLPYKE